MTGTVLWEPPADVRETSRIGHYLSWLERERGLRLRRLRRALGLVGHRSVRASGSSIWDYFEVIAHDQPTAVLADATMPGAVWFPGATLNYAEHVLRMPGLGDDDPVVLAYSQSREPITLTAAAVARPGPTGPVRAESPRDRPG